MLIAKLVITGAVAEVFVPPKSPANCTFPVALTVASGVFAPTEDVETHLGAFEALSNVNTSPFATEVAGKKEVTLTPD